jgi:hypothetical protein
MAALKHAELLTLARKVHAAALDRDPRRLERAARRFAAALAEHLQEEAVSLNHLSPPQARMVDRGQKRIQVRVQALIEDASTHCTSGGGRCSINAEELLALVVLQARDERRLLGDPAA